MDKKKAYEIVVDDIMNNGASMFQGHYDAKNGNKHFMLGICTLLEYLAFQVSEEKGYDISERFIQNVIASEEKVKEV